MEKYLENTYYVDYCDSSVRSLAKELKLKSSNDVSLIQMTYEYVRDKIHHSWDVQDKRVTVTASDVLREGVGICWAKAEPCRKPWMK